MKILQAKGEGAPQPSEEDIVKKLREALVVTKTKVYKSWDQTGKLLIETAQHAEDLHVKRHETRESWTQLLRWPGAEQERFQVGRLCLFPEDYGEKSWTYRMMKERVYKVGKGDIDATGNKNENK